VLIKTLVRLAEVNETGCFNRLEVGYWVYKGAAEEPEGHVVEIQVAKGKYSDYDEDSEAAEVTAIVIEKRDSDEFVTIPADEWMADGWCW